MFSGKETKWDLDIKRKINNDWNGIVNMHLKSRRFKSSGTRDRKKCLFWVSGFLMTREHLKFKLANKYNNVRILFENKKPLFVKNRVEKTN